MGGFTALIVFAIGLHTLGFFLFNKYRIRKTIWFLQKMRGKELEEDYELLINRYTGFFNYIETFPRQEGFSKLYQNEEFCRFVANSKRLLKYFFIILPALFVLMLLSGFVDQL